MIYYLMILRVSSCIFVSPFFLQGPALWPSFPMSSQLCSDAALIAALAQHPRCTAGSDGHPMPDRCSTWGNVGLPR